MSSDVGEAQSPISGTSDILFFFRFDPYRLGVSKRNTFGLSSHFGYRAFGQRMFTRERPPPRSHPPLVVDATTRPRAATGTRHPATGARRARRRAHINSWQAKQPPHCRGPHSPPPRVGDWVCAGPRLRRPEHLHALCGMRGGLPSSQLPQWPAVRGAQPAANAAAAN